MPLPTYQGKTVTIEQWTAECYLDARGLACPMPLLKLKQQINRMQPGERILVETTDAGSLRDFDAFCRQAQHTILDQSTGSEDEGAVYRFLIRKFVASGAGE